MLQKGSEHLLQKLSIEESSCTRAHLNGLKIDKCHSYFETWQNRVKSGKSVSLMSFMLKTLEKLAERYLKNYRDQYAYQVG